jgi:hypothetical protein
MSSPSLPSLFTPPSGRNRLWRGTRFLLGLLTLAVALVGCRSAPPPTGEATVTGKVLVGGKPPVTGSSIEFIGPDGKAASAPVDRDGSYNLTNAPLGECKVVVKSGKSTELAVGKGAEMPGMPSSSGVAVPAKYGQPGQLTFSVQKGKNTKDFDLAP